jgi:UDP-N-acetyl-D-mannosaminuronic acid dehydrogenase
MEKVCVVGLGYIGLPTAALLAANGFTVRGVDVRDDVVETINQGAIHIHEPDLDVLVKDVVKSGALQAATEPAAADVYILAVPTPFSEGFVPDLSYVEAATRAIAPFLAAGNLVILESTSPVGTTDKIGDWLRELRPDLSIPQAASLRPRNGASVEADAGENGAESLYLAHCPERVLPGQILRELIENDRIVGGIDAASSDKAHDFYSRFVTGEVFRATARAAELAKLSENSFRDVNIAFANELSMICEQLDIDVWEVIALANRHPRVNILQPGPGVGGHCIAVDPWFIVNAAPERAHLIRTAREVNDSKPHHVLDRIREEIHTLKQSGHERPVVACLGLAFKADVDDLRESPAVEIVADLAKEHVGRLLAVEPYVESLPQTLAGRGVELVELERALEEANLLVVLVNHSQFKAVDPARLQDKIIIDTRGIWREVAGV